ncbi:MAG: hypothetical protein ACTSQD_01475 [Promethearchaeota archaeon]|jgi:hypothetical protein
MESSSKDKIEKIIFKLLYELKSIKSTNILVEKILEKTLEEKITISEKNIKLIIDELKNEKKIQFNQKDGWKMLF